MLKKNSSTKVVASTFSRKTYQLSWDSTELTFQSGDDDDDHDDDDDDYHHD